MNTRNDTVWQSAYVAYNFLDNVRGAIPLAGEQIDVMLRVVRTVCPKVERFLDLGCGDGVLGRALLAQHPNTQGVFLDFSAPMIDSAKAKVGDDARCTFVVQDYSDPQWIESVRQQAPFDAIISGFSIHHQPDARKKELYAELFTLLKPGGIFLNLEHVSSLASWGESLFDEIMIDTMTTFVQNSGVNKTREQVTQEFHSRPDKMANILAPTETQCEWLREIGYVDVDCYFKIFELALFGGRRPTS